MFVAMAGRSARRSLIAFALKVFGIALEPESQSDQLAIGRLSAFGSNARSPARLRRALAKNLWISHP